MKGKLRKAIVCMVMALMFALPLNVAQAAPKTVQIMKVTADYVRVRSEPKQGDNVLTRVRKNSKVFYIGASKTARGWYKIRTDHGTIGYLYKDYLRSYGAAKLSNIYMVKSSSLSMYKKPKTNSGRVTTLGRNEHVIVYEIQGSWAYVRTLSGKGGFVKVGSLKKAA